jgi:hypothetical protein
MELGIVTVGQFNYNVTRQLTPEEFNVEIARSINAVVKRYWSELGAELVLDWKLGIGFNKMVQEAQNLVGFSTGDSKEAKKARREQFNLVCGIFDNEGINVGIDKICEMLDFKPRVKKASKKGIISIDMVPPHVANSDAIGKAAKELAKTNETRDLREFKAKALADGYKPTFDAETGEKVE